MYKYVTVNKKFLKFSKSLDNYISSTESQLKTNFIIDSYKEFNHSLIFIDKLLSCLSIFLSNSAILSTNIDNNVSSVFISDISHTYDNFCLSNSNKLRIVTTELHDLSSTFYNLVESNTIIIETKDFTLSELDIFDDLFKSLNNAFNVTNINLYLDTLRKLHDFYNSANFHNISINSSVSINTIFDNNTCFNLNLSVFDENANLLNSPTYTLR
ncbi:MAG: hypothetical protein ACRCSG_00915, partial [Cellulosilyticaceae bacterium]